MSPFWDLFFSVVLGCSRQSSHEPVTVTFLDNEYDTPDRLPGLPQDLQEFTRETGIQVKRLPRPEGSLNQLAMWSELLQKAKESNADGIDMVLESGGKDVGIYALIAATIRDFEKLRGTGCDAAAITRSPRRASVTHSYFGRGRLVATRRYGRRPSLRRKKTGSLARQTHRRNLCAVQPEHLHTDQPTAKQVPHHLQHGHVLHSWNRSRFRCVLRFWWLLEHSSRRLLVPLASILEGCDGEVARLKLQESAFGCWLETARDYLFYLCLFVGMTVGLWKSSGARMYVLYGGMLLFGAIASVLATGWER